MPTPLVLSTWSFGSIANQAAWPILTAGGSAIDAVEAGCVAAENDPSVDSVGIGGLPDRSGRVSLDGCVMLSPSRCGSVACLRAHAHPVSVARLVMERTQHVMLVGPDADRFADSMGCKTVADLTTPMSRNRYAQWKASHPQAANDFTAAWHPQEANVEEARNRDHDTVGVLAIDSHGKLAGACSTSGRFFKVPGRVGDSPIIGHGLYVHPDHGACVTTGTGELVMGVCGAFLAVELMRSGETPANAAQAVLERIRESYTLRPEFQVGLITLRPDGVWSHASLKPGYCTQITDRRGPRQEWPTGT